MRKKILRSVAQVFLPPVIGAWMWFLYLTNKKRWHLSSGVPDTPFVVTFWHCELLMAHFAYKKVANRDVNVMISDHFDGEIIAKTISMFGIKPLRGSSRKGAARVLMGAIKAIREGENVALTPDGPIGPRHSVSDGAVTIAAKSGVPIVVINVVPEKYWQAKSWDRFVIPKPFGAIDFYVSDPIDIKGLQKDEAKSLLKERMLEHAVG
ncbi:lysophospholipid acyltransferase family protein [Hydrogenimonas sp.]